jgi:hypothetical protein
MSVALADTYERRQAVIATERAAWPDQYAAVREAIQRGVWPDAYGSQSPPPYLLPPTKFAYPAGGLAYPHHAGGKAAGSRLWVWSFEHDSPDELQGQTVWFAGDNTGNPMLNYLYRSRGGLTLDEAFATCERWAAHLRANFIVPIWHGERPDPELTTADWRELLAYHEPSARPRQASLFAPVELTATERAQQAIADCLRPFPGEVPQTLVFPSGTLYDVENLIERVNWERSHAIDRSTALAAPGGSR